MIQQDELPVSNSTGRAGRLLFLDSWVLGGSTIFNAGLGALLADSHGYQVSGYSLEPIDEAAFGRELIRFPVQGAKRRRLTRRGWLADSFEALRQIDPGRLICTVNWWNCEMARHLPERVVKIGVVHAVDPQVIERACLYSEYFDAIVSVSRLGFERLTGALPQPRCPVHFIPPGILMPAAGWQRLSNKDQPLRLLYLGRLTQPSKRARDMVGIVKALRKNQVPFQWTIAGDGDEREYIRTSLEDAGIKEVVMLGAVNHGEVAGLFATHDVIVFTSEQEAFPLSLQEAMAHGMVPVAARAPGRVSEVVDLAGGFLVDINDAEGFALAIAKLDADRELLNRMSSQAAAAIPQDLSWSSIAARWHQLLSSPALQPRDQEPWPAKVRIQPNPVPLFPGCPGWVKEAFDWLLEKIDRLDFQHVRRIRRIGYRLRGR